MIRDELSDPRLVCRGNQTGNFVLIAHRKPGPASNALTSAMPTLARKPYPAVRAAFVDAIADGEPEPFLHMEVTDDLLVR